MRHDVLRKLELLDSKPDRTIDRLVKMAAKVFQVPVSCVSLIDKDRQVCRSAHGVERKETPREVSFCSHTIAKRSTMIVPDALLDERFKNNPLVTGKPGIRFYAGSPIFTVGNVPLGALCIVDTKPHDDLTVDEIAILESLASMTSEALHRSASTHLRESNRTVQRRHALAAMTTIDGVWEWNTGEDKVYYSKRCQQLLGLAETEIVAKPGYWFDRIHPEDKKAMLKQIARQLRGHESTFHVEHRVRHSDGNWRWVKAHGFIMRGERGRCENVIGSFLDVTTLRSYDVLTGLPNRSTFIDSLADQLQIAVLDGTGWPAVLMVNIVRFSRLNDRFGASQADRILRDIGRRLSDTVSLLKTGPQSLVARHEGDKFLILLQNVEDQSVARYLAGRIQDAVSVPFLCNDVPVRAEVSIGVALASKHHKTEELIQNAQIALQRACAEGGSKCAVFTLKMLEENDVRARLEIQMREAIENNELRVFYQPQFDLRTGKLVGCEALVRWQHPQFGLLTPDAFLPLAEENGFISAIDLWVMKTACEQVARWRRVSRHVANLRLSVNLSSHKFSELRLHHTISGILRQNALPASALCLEITETVLMRDVEDAIPILSSLRRIGVGLHLDDFGAGYSSFAQLYSLPFDTLKIDRSFLRNILTDTKAKAIVEAILGLGKQLGLSVIAEGVEEEGHRVLLKKLGCDGAQGYFYSRPVDALQFEDKFIERRRRARAKITEPNGELVPELASGGLALASREVPQIA